MFRRSKARAIRVHLSIYVCNSICMYCQVNNVYEDRFLKINIYCIYIDIYCVWNQFLHGWRNFNKGIPQRITFTFSIEFVGEENLMLHGNLHMDKRVEKYPCESSTSQIVVYNFLIFIKYFQIRNTSYSQVNYLTMSSSQVFNEIQKNINRTNHVLKKDTRLDKKLIK